MAKTAAEKQYVRDLNARLPAGINRCSFCGLFKGDDQFSPGQRWSGSRRTASYECRTCSTARARRYRDTLSPETKKARSRKWSLSRNYGMTHDDYLVMVEAQGNTCAICKRDDPQHPSGMWNIDHCHSSGKVRSLLCSPCNQSLGKFEDNPEWLRAAADYLEAHREDN